MGIAFILRLAVCGVSVLFLYAKLLDKKRQHVTRVAYRFIFTRRIAIFTGRYSLRVSSYSERRRRSLPRVEAWCLHPSIILVYLRFMSPCPAFAFSNFTQLFCSLLVKLDLPHFLPTQWYKSRDWWSEEIRTWTTNPEPIYFANPRPQVVLPHRTSLSFALSLTTLNATDINLHPTYFSLRRIYSQL